MAAAVDPRAIFTSICSCFGGRLDVKRAVGGPDGDAPLLKVDGKTFAMLHGGELVVHLHPMRCAALVEAGEGRLLVHNGQTFEDWFVAEGFDGAEWRSHTEEALAWAKDS